MQPQSGATGEYAGLMAIKDYHKSIGEGQRDICLIPTSAHGTNPATASLCGLKILPLNCDDQGNIDVKQLEKHCQKHAKNLSCIMITYPSTHGVFEKDIR
jgi:glycine dehydrogenase